MLSIFKRRFGRAVPSRPNVASQRLNVRLGLLRLEGRDVPAAPALSGVSGRVLGDYWVVTGQVVDDDAGNTQVNVSGSASGSATVAADGSFSFISQHSGSGTITLQATDTKGLNSLPQVLNLAPMPYNLPPYIVLQITPGERRMVTIAGEVFDEHPGGLTVTLGGVVNVSTTTDEHGLFSVTLDVSHLGNVSGLTHDAEGLASNLALGAITTLKPEILNLTWSLIGDTCTIRGQVNDESPEGLVVVFDSSMAAFAGMTATVDAGGWFELSETIPMDQTLWATITLQVTDWWGISSDLFSVNLV